MALQDKKVMSDDPYKSIATAIVMHALYDYRSALRKLRKEPDNKNAIWTIESVERFLRSGWFEMSFKSWHFIQH